MLIFQTVCGENFARHRKLMRFFVEHKEDIIPRIVQRIKKDEATEDEKDPIWVFTI